MANNNSDGFETIRKFLTPILLLVIGWLLSTKLKTIDDKVDEIVKIQITIASQATQISNLQRDQQQLRDDLREHVNDPLLRQSEAILSKTKKYKRDEQ